MTETTEGWAPFGAWRTWYRIVGDLSQRMPLVCVHGGPGSSHHYFTPLEAMAERGRPIVLYDQVGCGGSSRPPVDELDVPVFVAELANLRSHLDLERFFLLGTSWGGILAIEYYLAHPEGIVGLVLNSTLASAASWASEVALLRDRMPPEEAEVLQTNDVDDARYQEAERAFNARHVCRLTDAPELRRMAEASNPDVYRALWGPNEWTITGKLAGWDVRSRLHEISVPVLLSSGTDELCTPAILDELHSGLRHADRFVFENSAHMPQLEEPERFIEVLSRFLDRHD